MTIRHLVRWVRTIQRMFVIVAVILRVHSNSPIVGLAKRRDPGAVNAHQGVSLIQNDHVYNTLMLRCSIVYSWTQICTRRMPVGNQQLLDSGARARPTNQCPLMAMSGHSATP